MDIQGWFNFQRLYSVIANRLAASKRETPIAVEVGVWKGKSIIELARLVRELTEGTATCPLIYAVDHWDPDPLRYPPAEREQLQEETPYEVYDANVSTQGYRDDITDIRVTSVQAAKQFEDASLDFVFIDADHSAVSVAEDIRAWLPKADVLAGHDIGTPSVREGVEAVLGESYYIMPAVDCWTTSREVAAAVNGVQERIVLGVPTGNGCIRGEVTRAVMNAELSPRDVRVCFHGTSLLTLTFNELLCRALNQWRSSEGADWFVMLHDDIAPAPRFWIDQLVNLLDEHGADVASVVSPIKSGRGLTSVGIDTDRWRPLRLTMKQLYKMPPVIGNWQRFNEYGQFKLLFNTGCMAIRLGEWLRGFAFDFSNRIVETKDGFQAECEPEDWKFSRWCNERGRRAIVTRDIKLTHFGHAAFYNSHAWGSWETDQTNSPDKVGAREAWGS